MKKQKCTFGTGYLPYLCPPAPLYLLYYYLYMSKVSSWSSPKTCMIAFPHLFPALQPGEALGWTGPSKSAAEGLCILRVPACAVTVIPHDLCYKSEWLNYPREPRRSAQTCPVPHCLTAAQFLLHTSIIPANGVTTFVPVQWVAGNIWVAVSASNSTLLRESESWVQEVKTL